MIKLRKIEPTDIPYLYQWENDATSWASSGVHNPLSQKDLRDYVDASTGDVFRDGQLRLVIEENGQSLGCIDLFDLDPVNRRAAIGIYVSPMSRGRGVGEQAVRLLEELAFEHLNLRLLYCVIATNNEPSLQIFRSLKYDFSSVLKGWTLQSDAVICQKMRVKE
ncbi:MAG: GNAT family N-acetyltransferase [Paludibacteraceae bacterium]|nr:GNAT family N-acetyltransferase [Paludibacteraceae bacterium]